MSRPQRAWLAKSPDTKLRKFMFELLGAKLFVSLCASTLSLQAEAPLNPRRARESSIDVPAAQPGKAVDANSWLKAVLETERSGTRVIRIEEASGTSRRYSEADSTPNARRAMGMERFTKLDKTIVLLDRKVKN